MLECAGSVRTGKIHTLDKKAAPSEIQMRKEWEAVETLRDIHRPAMERIISQFFDEQEAALAPSIKMIDFSGFFDFNFWKRRFLDLLLGNIRQVLEEGVLAGMLRAGLGRPTQEQLEARNIQYDIIARQVARSELVNKHTENDITTMLVEMVQANATQNEMQAALRQKFEGYRSYRVDRITNTIVVGAFESGTLLSWQEAGITSKGWLSTADERVRTSHDTRLNPQLTEPIDINEPFVVGGVELAHPGDPNGAVSEIVNCFIGETDVYSPNIERAYRGFYEGEIVTVKTKSGHEVTGTPNHPILTPRGFIGLGSLNKGDSILSCSKDEWSALSSLDIQNMPSAIEKVFDSLSILGAGVRSSRGVVDFYGDRMNGNIDIVDIFGELANRSETSFSHPFKEEHFSFTNLTACLELCNRLFSARFMMELRRHIADGFIRGSDQLLTVIERCLGHAGVHRLATVTNSGTGFNKPTMDYLPTYPEGASKSLDRLASGVSSNDGININTMPATNGQANPLLFQSSPDCFGFTSVSSGDVFDTFPVQVSLDEIRDVTIGNNFSGHVYTLQTKEGIYLAEGIVSRNCRCTMIPVIDE